jgi:hypothetical protein
MQALDHSGSPPPAASSQVDYAGGRVLEG